MIAAGKVVDLTSHFVDNGAAIYTVVTLQVVEVYTENDLNTLITDEGQLTFNIPGGQIDDNVSSIEWGPSFLLNEEVIVLLGLSPESQLWLTTLSNKIEIGYDDSIYDAVLQFERERILGILQSGEGFGLVTPEVQSEGIKKQTAAFAPNIAAINPTQPAGVDPFGFIEITGSDFVPPKSVHFVKRYTPSDGYQHRTYPFEVWKKIGGQTQRARSERLPIFDETFIRVWPSNRELLYGSLSGGISSGPVIVRTESSEAFSQDNLQVEYSYGHSRWSTDAISEGIAYRINTASLPANANYDENEAIQAIQQAFDSWEVGTDIDFIYEGGSTAGRHRSDGLNVVSWVDFASVGGLPDQATAVAMVSLVRGFPNSVITDADIILNTHQQPWLHNSPDNLASTMVHEVGHLLGLADLAGAGDDGKLMHIQSAYNLRLLGPDERTQAGINRVYGAWSGPLAPAAGVTVWPDTIRVSGDVTVMEGDTLRVEAGAVVQLAASDDQKGGELIDRAEILVCGTLKLNGTSERPVVLQSESGSQEWNFVQELDSGTSDCQSVTAVQEYSEPTQPAVFELFQNYPNPFNPQTTFRFDLPVPADIDVSLYNLAGQKVVALVSGRREAGRHTLRWDGRGDDGSDLASGVYIYRMQVRQSVTMTRRMVLVR